MTEQEWLTSGDAEVMVRFVETRHRAARTKQGRRKLRLFGSACFRSMVEHQRSEMQETELAIFREVIEVAERYADGLADKDELRRAREKVIGQTLAEWLVSESPQEAWRASRWYVIGDPTWPYETTDQRRAATMREIFGNPFRAVPFSAPWRTGTALMLARQMYESRDFGAMPILAGLGFAALIGAVGGLLPAWSAARKGIIEAMRDV